MKACSSRVLASRAAERGVGFIEIMISASILSIVAFGAVVFFRGTMRSMEDSAQSSRDLNVATAGQTYLERDFAHASPERIAIESVCPCYDEVRLQVPVDLDASGPVWGAVSPRPIEVGGEPRQRHPDWKIRYRVDGTQLIRDLVDDAGVAVAGSAIVIARDLLPYSSSLLRTVGGNLTGPKIFRIWQPDPSSAERIYAGVLTTAVPRLGDSGRLEPGSPREHRITLRAERN